MAKTVKHVSEYKRIKRVESNTRHNYKANLRRFADYITEEHDDGIELDVELENSVHSGERSKS